MCHNSRSSIAECAMSLFFKGTGPTRNLHWRAGGRRQRYIRNSSRPGQATLDDRLADLNTPLLEVAGVFERARPVEVGPGVAGAAVIENAHTAQ